ncbi:DinB family protein [Paenibacillus sp. GCM10027627]|uniref:DinB family protein n=1 Tax=unclassified Paenibacillus TaxID=185978 RepID=UPI00363E5851
MALTDKRVYSKECGDELVDLRNEKLHMATLKGAELHSVDARDSSLLHVNFDGSKWNHIQFSNVHIKETQLGGTVFENIRRPKASESARKEEGFRGIVQPVRFVYSDLSEAIFDECDLSGAELNLCRTEGMRINGISVDELLKVYEERRELPESIKKFRKIREETIAFAESVPSHRLDAIPEGFNNSIRWNLGHLLAAWDHGIFPKIGEAWRIPANYHSLFPRGTSPRDWKETPPSISEIVSGLRRQKEDVSAELPHRLADALAEPFLNMSAMSDMLEFLLCEEQHHQKAIKSIVEALERGASFEQTTAVPFIVKRPSFIVAGVTLQGNLKDIREQRLGHKAYSRLTAMKEGITGVVSNEVYLVQMYPMRMDFDPLNDPFTQLIGYKVEEGATVPEGLILHRLESTEYVRYTHRGPEAEIASSYNLVYRNWLHEHNRKSLGFDFEIRDERYLGENPDNEIDMFIALAPEL